MPGLLIGGGHGVSQPAEIELFRDPKPGDVLTMRDGRKRTVVSANYWIRYQYTNGNGVVQSVSARPLTWRQRCSAELANGGSYERPAEEDGDA